MAMVRPSGRLKITGRRLLSGSVQALPAAPADELIRWDDLHVLGGEQGIRLAVLTTIVDAVI
jgi:hypothetical protein